MLFFDDGSVAGVVSRAALYCPTRQSSGALVLINYYLAVDNYIVCPGAELLRIVSCGGLFATYSSAHYPAKGIEVTSLVWREDQGMRHSRNGTAVIACDDISAGVTFHPRTDVELYLLSAP